MVVVNTVKTDVALNVNDEDIEDEQCEEGMSEG